MNNHNGLLARVAQSSQHYPLGAKGDRDWTTAMWLTITNRHRYLAILDVIG